MGDRCLVGQMDDSRQGLCSYIRDDRSSLVRPPRASARSWSLRSMEILIVGTCFEKETVGKKTAV